MADIDKGLYQLPTGLDQVDTTGAADIGVDVELPSMEDIGDFEGMDVMLGGLDAPVDAEFDANLAETLPDDVLETISSQVMEDYESDTAARKDWIDTYVDGLELLGMKIEDRTEPWPGACAVYHPLLAETLVKFQAETMMETFPAAGPVKTAIIGKQSREKEEAAVRVKDDMNYQLTEKMPEYRPEHERLLWGLGLSGNAFKKVYFDPNLQRQAAIFVPAEDVIVPYGASNLQTSPRVTHVMRKTENDIKKLQVAGFYRDVELGEPSSVIEEIDKKIAEKMGFNATMDDRYKILESQVDLDLAEYGAPDEFSQNTGIALPYIVTLDAGTGAVLAIRRNWHPDDATQAKRAHFVHYGYIPGFGFYCFGLIHLIGAFAKSGTMLLRQLVDAGTLSNLPGGFKTRGLRIKGDDTPIAPAEFRDVDVPSGTIKDNILPLPYKEPSQVLQSLMNGIIDEGRNFASAADLQVSDMSANSPVGTTLAILERSLKVMSAVQARIHYAMKQEFQLLKNIIRDYAPDDYSYDPESGDRRARRSDYDLVEVIPVSDPNAATMSQKVVQYQAVMQMAQANPQIYDLPELNKQMLEVLGIKNIGKLIPSTEEQKPKDPVSENMAIMNGKPVKAFLNQDHQAHIQVHMSAMQDPKIMQLMGQNPKAQAIQAAAFEHIQAHIAFEYRKQVEQQLGAPLPGPDEVLPEDVEVQISPLIAQAAQQLLQKNQAEAAQQQAQQQAQDPLMQMQMQELQLKQQEVAIKGKKTDADIALDKEKLALEGFKVGYKVTDDAARRELEQQKHDDTHQLNGFKTGLQAYNDNEQRNMQQEQAQNNLAHQAAQSHADRRHQADQQDLSMLGDFAKQHFDHAHQASQAQNKPKPERKPRK